MIRQKKACFVEAHEKRFSHFLIAAGRDAVLKGLWSSAESGPYRDRRRSGSSSTTCRTTRTTRSHHRYQTSNHRPRFRCRKGSLSTDHPGIPKATLRTQEPAARTAGLLLFFDAIDPATFGAQGNRQARALRRRRWVDLGHRLSNTMTSRTAPARSGTTRLRRSRLRTVLKRSNARASETAR